MKVLIDHINVFLKIESLRVRGLLITIMILKDSDPEVWDMKVRKKLKMTGEDNVVVDLIWLHDNGYIEWSGADKVKKKWGLKEYDEEVKEAIEFYNNLTGRKLSYKKESQTKLLRARLIEGYTLNEIKKVIANRYEEWKDNDVMAKNLYPTTLFRPSKFPKYLEESKRTKVGMGIVGAKKLNLKPGTELTSDIVKDFEDKDTYLIKIYRVNEETGEKVGIGFKGSRYGKDIKRTIKVQEAAVMRGEPKEFIYTYIEK